MIPMTTCRHPRVWRGRDWRTGERRCSWCGARLRPRAETAAYAFIVGAFLFLFLAALVAAWHSIG